MAKIKAKKVTQKKKDSKAQFTVVREFSGGQSMQDAFEQLIERQTCELFEEWLEQKAG